MRHHLEADARSFGGPIHAIKRSANLRGVIARPQIKETEDRQVARGIRPFIVGPQSILIFEETAVAISESRELNLELIVTRRYLRQGAQINALSVHYQTGELHSRRLDSRASHFRGHMNHAALGRDP